MWELFVPILGATKASLKIFGKKILQKTILSKTIPVVGAVISGGWNFAETKVVGGRVIAYLNGQAIGQTAC